ARDREATVTIELAALAAGEGNETEGAVDTEESDDFHDQDVSSTPGTTAVDDADDQPQAADDVEQTADESGEDEGGSADADGAPGFDDEEFAEDEGPTPEQLDEEAE